MYNKEFIFFSLADAVLFHRNDAEQAEWTHQEFTLTCTFPYNPEKEITRGMRIGFDDSFGQFQLFEIRNVRNSEPDHVQELTAEHIVISELTDRHLMEYSPDDIVNASTAINAVLSGSGWSLGQCITSATHKPDLSMTNVWAALTEIRDMYGLRLEPYVTVSETAVTGRYINVIDNVGVWRGVRLSINKNIDQVGITYDDTNLVTAVYGYGASVDDEYTIPEDTTGDSSSSSDSSSDSSSSSSTPVSNSASSSSSSTDYGAPYVTIKNVVWEETEDHPAKPSGQMYLEDPDATALYGRNGNPRFGFYSNSDVDDPDELIELCWEALQRQNTPKVTIDCTISELRSYGMEGEAIRVGDTVRVDVEPLGVVLELMCICLTEDLLDPSNTRPTIGKYIKDIVYITKEQEDASGGGGGGGGGGANKDEIEQEKSVYTNFERTDEYILMQAVNIQTVEGALNTAFSEIYQTASEITAEVRRATGAEATLDGRITVNAGNIALVVTNGALNASLIVDAINGSSVTISADRINLNGYVTTSYLTSNYITSDSISSTYATISSLDTTTAKITNLTSGTTTAAALRANTVYAGSLRLNGNSIHKSSITIEGTTYNICTWG